MMQTRILVASSFKTAICRYFGQLIRVWWNLSAQLSDVLAGSVSIMAVYGVLDWVVMWLSW